MITFTITKNVSSEVVPSKLLQSLESIFSNNDFRVEKRTNELHFSRERSSKRYYRFKLIAELIRSFATGTINIAEQPANVVVCTINYSKHLLICAILGIVVSLIFSLMIGQFFFLILKIGIPIMLIFLAIGIYNGNNAIRECLDKISDK